MGSVSLFPDSQMRLLKARLNYETLLRKQMLSSLAARETYAAETIFFFA